MTNGSTTAFDGSPMPLSRRLLVFSLAVSPLAGPRPAAAADPGTAPAALVQRFYDDLLAVMKEAKRLSFDQRYSRLTPAVNRSFDLPLMTRIAIGPGWTQIAASSNSPCDSMRVNPISARTSRSRSASTTRRNQRWTLAGAATSRIRNSRDHRTLR